MLPNIEMSLHCGLRGLIIILDVCVTPDYYTGHSARLSLRLFISPMSIIGRPPPPKTLWESFKLVAIIGENATLCKNMSCSFPIIAPPFHIKCCEIDIYLIYTCKQGGSFAWITPKSVAVYGQVPARLKDANALYMH